MYTFENYELGRTDDMVNIESREENRSATIKMAHQFKQSMEIISRELDSSIYDDPEFLDAVKKTIFENQRTKIRIIILNPQIVTKHGHRLVTLTMDLTTFIEIRKPGIEHSGFNEAMLLADGCGYIHRKKSNRFEGSVNFNDRRTCKYLLDHFNEIWSKSTMDHNFRKLQI